MGNDTLTVVLGGREDVKQQLSQLRRGVLFVPLPEPAPEPLQELSVAIHAGAMRAEIRARVVQLMPPAGMALECGDADELAQQLHEAAATWQGEEGEGSVSRWGQDEAEEEEPQDDDRPLHERIREMSTPEKRKLALHGDKQARTLLMKDPNKLLHNFVIQNKGITVDEVRYIAGYRQTNPETLKQISENREWMQNPRIVMALVTNPKTPSTVATKLLGRLPKSDLRRIAKSGNIPRAVSAAAKKMVIGGR